MRTILVRRLGVASVARFVGYANAILGFIYGVVLSFGAVAGIVDHDSWNAVSKVLASTGAVVACLVIVPLLSFIAGWLYGAILALVSNLFLSTARGIEMEIEDVEESVVVRK